MTTATRASTVPAMVTVGGCPPGNDDCHHPGLPHISDFTGAGPWCHAASPDGRALCTLPPLHSGPHIAGNGGWITASWEPDPATDWRQWSPNDGAATRLLPVLSWVYAEGEGGCITSGGFQWYPPHERDVLPAAVVAAYRREVSDTYTPARVRLLLFPAPAGIVDQDLNSDPAARQVITDWIDSRTDEIEVDTPALCEAIITPGDPEPRVQVMLQKQYTDARGYDVDAAEPSLHNANAALRAMPRQDVTSLRDADYTSDEFVLANGWLGGHRGGFYARFEGDGLFYDECDADGLPLSLRDWLVWADKYQHLLGV